MQITQEQADIISTLGVGDTCEGFTLIEVGPWRSYFNHDMATRYQILLYGGQHYKAIETRTNDGTDWFYELSLSLTPVQKVEIVSHEWRTL